MLGIFRTFLESMEYSWNLWNILGIFGILLESLEYEKSKLESAENWGYTAWNLRNIGNMVEMFGIFLESSEYPYSKLPLPHRTGTSPLPKDRNRGLCGGGVRGASR